MADLFNIALSMFFGVMVLLFAILMRQAMRVLIATRRATPTSAADVRDGEYVLLTGTVTVDEPAPHANRLVNESAPVGAYLWRGASPDETNTIDFEERTVREQRNTFASGIEAGQFSIDDGTGSVRVDPTWLRDAYDGVRPSDASVGNYTLPTFSARLWDTPAVYLTSEKTTHTIDRVGDVFEDVSDDIDHNYYAESLPIVEGDDVAVVGSIKMDRGEPVVRGDDETTFAISNAGIDGFRRYLRWYLVKHGAGCVILILVFIVIWQSLN